MIRGLFSTPGALLAIPACLALAGLPCLAQAQESSGRKPGAIERQDQRARPSSPRGAEPKANGAAAGDGPAQIATSGDWSAYATKPGRARVCYALAQPKSRQPATLKDTPGYAFISYRPADKVRNEVSLVMNFDLKEGVDHQLQVGSNQFALVAKGKNLWVKNPADELKVIDAMRRAGEMTVKGTSNRSNATTDRYSLKGFGEALEKAQKACQ